MHYRRLTPATCEKIGTTGKVRRIVAAYRIIGDPLVRDSPSCGVRAAIGAVSLRRTSSPEKLYGKEDLVDAEGTIDRTAFRLRLAAVDHAVTLQPGAMSFSGMDRR
jgi:hypothetical protein